MKGTGDEKMTDRLKGARGNLSMFRSVPRERLNAREDVKLVAPPSTKYSPGYGYIHNEVSKNINFGDKGEQETIRKMNYMRERNASGHVCSKGATKCFSSVKRVK